MTTTSDSSRFIRIQANIEAATHRIAPLWPLKDFVAVNPFLGFSNRTFADAAALFRRVGHADILMPSSYFLEQFEQQNVSEIEFQAALLITRKAVGTPYGDTLRYPSFSAFKQVLRAAIPPDHTDRMLTFSEFVDASLGSRWSEWIVDEISKWCSAYFDEGQSSWRMPWRDLGLFQAWRQASVVDRNPELMGLKGFRRRIAGTGDNLVEIIQDIVDDLGIPGDKQIDFLHRQILTVTGWSSYIQYFSREQRTHDSRAASVSDLLAIRMIFDAAVFAELQGNTRLIQQWTERLQKPASGAEFPDDLLKRYLAQQTLEYAYQNRLTSRLTTAPPASGTQRDRKVLQAIFCIDVRSEVFRRALENQSDSIETLGFAGFFGMPVRRIPFGESTGPAQCPVLLQPGYCVHESPVRNSPEQEAVHLDRLQFRRSLADGWNSFKTSAISCFSFVETIGLSYAAKMALDGWNLTQGEPSDPGSDSVICLKPRGCDCSDKSSPSSDRIPEGISVQDQVRLAAGALRNMSLTRGFARVVLLCGHGSATQNNPYRASLDCGACGGHAGGFNARVAATILNRPEVRQGLMQQGIHVPDDTQFIAGLHNTTTDEVVLYSGAEEAPVPLEIRGWLADAGRAARRERAGSLEPGGICESDADDQILGRSRDWSQVRPEWGLAGNAAFIAAPRERTRHLKLDGRAFLHNYSFDQDSELAVLELILAAPVVVASWINLQYYGSTVNNRVFGSGDKVLHNVVGTLGIWQGNGGDLQTGLPIQSLHDGKRWRHEPLRLSVYLEAPRKALDQVLAAQQGVSELFENGWLQLFSLEPGSQNCWRYAPDGTWELMG